MKLTINDLVNAIDYSEASRIIIDFIRNYVFNVANVDNVVIGVSGGVDSSTTLTLLVKALSNNRVIALIMPDSRVTPREDVEDAVKLCENLGVKYLIIDIDNMVDLVTNKVSSVINQELDYKTIGNVRARVRALTLYTIANKLNAIVVGTGDKSEILLGYFTKYGDGAADIMPIGDLYKTQVRYLAKYLGLPEKIVFKPSSPRLWPGQTAENELGLKYEEIDLILYSILELKLKPSQVPEIINVEKWKVDKVLKLLTTNEHKRKLPVIPKVSKGPTVGIDWRTCISKRIEI